jgi:hypothetical protein
VTVGQELLREKCQQPPLKNIGIARPALPDCENRPTLSPQASDIVAIAHPSLETLLRPIIPIRFGHHATHSTAMRVPETTVYEYDLAMTRKNQVRAAGQRPLVQSKAEAETMDKAADNTLWLRVPRPDSGHCERALFRCQIVHLTEFL